MSAHISNCAEAAREQYRSEDGRFGPQPASEAELQLDDAAAEAEKEEVRELARAARTLSLDPNTGAAPPVIRNYSWHGEGEDEGNFAMWSEDLLNTPAECLSDRALDDLNSTWSFVEEAASDPENATAEDVAQAAYDTYWGYDAASSDIQDSPDGELWVALARTARGDQPTDAQSVMAAEVAAHEADGGSIEVDRHDGGTVRWQATGDEHSPLYRATSDTDGAPALFNPAGQPMVWMRGSARVREVYDDGEATVYDPRTGNPVHRLTANGEFTHFDPDSAWDEHRDPREGPSRFDEDGARWFTHEEPHRDHVDGPAIISWDGDVVYSEHGRTVHPPDEVLERHQVERVPDYTRPDGVSYRLKGSTAGVLFDLTGHPLDHGHRITEAGPEKDLVTVAHLMTLNIERHNESESEHTQLDSAEVKGLIREGHPAANRLRARFPAEAAEVDQEADR